MNEEIISLGDYLVPQGNLHNKAAAEGFCCANCETAFAVKTSILVFREGFAEPSAYCSKSCLVEDYLDEVEFRDE